MIYIWVTIQKLNLTTSNYTLNNLMNLKLTWFYLFITFQSFSYQLYLVKVSNGKIRRMCEICSKWTVHQEQRTTSMILIPLLLTLNKFHISFEYIHRWRRISKCRLGFSFCYTSNLIDELVVSWSIYKSPF